MTKRQSGTVFYCFSPPVMIATFVAEIAMFAYASWRYKFTLPTKLICAMLATLALFQLSEYLVCTQSAAMWSRVGFAATTSSGVEVAKSIVPSATSLLRS